MNPQQYPPQPGQTPGYPGPQGPPNPYGQPYPPAPQGQPIPPAQPGQWQQPPAQPAPSYPQSQAGYPQPMAGPAPSSMPGPMPASGYNPYAFPGEYDKPVAKGPNKKVFIIIGAVVLILIIIGAAAAASGGGSSTGGTTTQTNTTEQTTSDAGKDVVPRSDNTLDLTKKINNKDTLKAQTIKAKTQEQVNLSSGFSFMVTKTEDYTSPNPTTKPADGKKFIVVTTIVGNRNQTGNVSVSYLDFRLRDANNQLIAGSGTTNELLNNPLSTPGEIKPGEQVTGKVVFEVAANDTNWVFKHSETYQKTTDNTTFTVEGEIVVQLAGASSTPTGTTPTTTTP